jgi:hypothetical protein
MKMTNPRERFLKNRLETAFSIRAEDGLLEVMAQQGTSDQDAVFVVSIFTENTDKPTASVKITSEEMIHATTKIIRKTLGLKDS